MSAERYAVVRATVNRALGLPNIDFAQAAEALGWAPEEVFKTLMTLVDGKAACVIVPSDCEVSMKKLAAALGAKSAQMMKPADAERLTGYKVGGVSPFGQRKAVPTVMDETAILFDRILINGGQRGLLLGLTPDEAARAAGAKLADLTA
ncbi:YbaK/EbsC family protein [uncultured Brevundimonas sp.]|uniref:YbaK/EbsC family protein n=1 Tax=uncultured Brevundimonas sp. TaxID=213418 RepID=UPI0025E55B95|nr:YbaK/EbsC family protein [uncultured Brevundimonas sp.]